ncbi:hypothetical protein ACVR1G_00300 [Streptococcus dentasini]
MKASYKGRLVEVWRISQLRPYPAWVAEAFKKHRLTWCGSKSIKVLIPALDPNWASDSHYYGYGMYETAQIGDVIDYTNGRIISGQFFDENYRTIGDW